MKTMLVAVFAVSVACVAHAGLFDEFSPSEELTTVSSKQFNGYLRTRLTDGSFAPETYCLAEGGNLPPATAFSYVVKDPTIDDVKFMDIARMIAPPLSDHGYVPSRDPKATRLMIMVFWGRNIGTPEIPELDAYNSSLLGFDSLLRTLGQIDPYAIMGQILIQSHDDMLSVVRVNRYFVIMRAFDFQAAWKKKALNLQWETRFSISERRHDFERDLPMMAQSASLYFGQDSYGFVRVPTLPEGRVNIGEIRTIADQENTGFPAQGPLPAMEGDWRGTLPGNHVVLIHVDRSGAVTFENKERHDVLPAQLSLKANAVIIAVPGWDMLFRGALMGDQIDGVLTEYYGSAHVTLKRTALFAAQ
jgi:hypothetical protein